MPGVGDHRDPLAAVEPLEHTGDGARLGVVVDDDQRRASDAGVLRGAGRCGGCPRSRWRRRRPSASTARGARSPRLPMGVPTRTSGTASVLPLELVADLEAPPRRTSPASASSTLWARSTGRVIRLRPRRTVRSTVRSASSQATSIGNRMPIECTERAGHEQQRAVDAVAAQQPLAAGARARRRPPATPAPPRRGATTASPRGYEGGEPIGAVRR